MAPPLDNGLVEIALPVYNEEKILARSVRTLHEHLTEHFPFPWRIVIVDNASTDGTAAIAAELARTLDGVDVLRLDRKGRGLALRTVWTASSADVVAYMDIDLSTNLESFLPLVSPLLSGHTDLSIGCRLGPLARVVRQPKREILSRGYNAIVRTVLRARFRDAQCGFKAIRREVVDVVVPEVEDDGWFFDTELLVRAERHGFRIFEVPVDWIEDLDTRVHIASTVSDDLAGVWRLRKEFWHRADRRSGALGHATSGVALGGPVRPGTRGSAG